MEEKGGEKTGKRNRVRFWTAFFTVLIVGIVTLVQWSREVEEDYAGESVVCEPISPISREERVRPEYLEDYRDHLRQLQDGDVLVTSCTHTFGWRNGHAALVVDASRGLTLEAVMLGSDSSLQSVEKWRGYPGVTVLRLRETPIRERKKMAKWALENLEGVPYGFSGDLLDRFAGGVDWNTHCAHLVWKTFDNFGFDVDGDGGLIVTPRDLYESPLFEVVESYGMKGW